MVEIRTLSVQVCGTLLQSSLVFIWVVRLSSTRPNILPIWLHTRTLPFEWDSVLKNVHLCPIQCNVLVLRLSLITRRLILWLRRMRSLFLKLRKMCRN